MSYSIMYDRQFIKSSQGITPCVLAGDNNVWTGSGKYERRARDWSVIGNQLAMSEKELLALAESWTGGQYQEHWMQNGKWVDDAGLMRWMKNGIKNAATIEEIISVNRFHSINCFLSVWTKEDHKIELDVYAKDNTEFDAWIEQANSRIAELKSQKNSVFPVVRIKSEFSNNKLQHPKPADAITPETVILKRGQLYLESFERNKDGKIRTASWSHYIKEALELPYNEAIAYMKEGFEWGNKTVKIVDAATKQLPYNAVIKIIGESYNGHFVRKITARKISFSTTPDGAMHYRDKKAADRALKNLLTKLEQKGYSAEVVILEEEEKSA